MLVSKKWLSRYLKTPLEISALGVDLTNLGLEVESIDVLGQNIEGIVSGRIESIEKHPDADKLVICQVNVGTSIVTIVTGATNVYEGMIVPVATVGGKVVQGKIKKSKLRGVESFGMLCSGEELGFDNSVLNDEEKNGIFPLPKDTPLGEDIKKIFDLDDVLYDIGLTPNRADCHGIYNVAREAAVAVNEKIVPLELNEGVVSEAGVPVTINNKELCHRYIARVIKDVQLGPSPMWFQNLLRNVGVRPISNLVDITNYVMLETGQPMHAFDLDTIEGNSISVKNAKAEEVFITLDGVERTLDEDMLVISDSGKTVALAGVMGGLNSEVTDKTQNVLLEAAHFNGPSIRRTSRKLGLRSDASSRFEKGLSEEMTLVAMNRACYLIELLGFGTVERTMTDNYPVHQVIPEIETSAEKINGMLGMSISEETIIDIFNKLEFETTVKNSKIIVRPLAHRIDIKEGIDLTEEVIRVYGYDALPAIMPEGTFNSLKTAFPITLTEQVKERMMVYGFNELVTYSFIDPQSLDKIRLSEGDSNRNVVKVHNPLSENQSIMRTLLLPGVLEVASNNYKHQQKELALFEVGRTFHPTQDGKHKESLKLGSLLLGREEKTWQGQIKYDFFYLKGVLERLSESLGFSFRLERLTDNPTFHPGRSGSIIINNQVVGVIGQLHPKVASTYDISEAIYYFELDLDGLKEIPLPQFKELPKYPRVERDIAILVPVSVTMEQIKTIIEKNALSSHVVGYRLFDVYSGSQIEKGYKSMAFAIIYQDVEKTLTDEEANGYHEVIVKSLEFELGAQLR